ncbi:RidA family protein [Pendulispora brunnea]|uniref:RidA family protein n=1 Tax=Pendulispora brunnea TaxID=2905690 RepID=A0ABZ2KCP2_9BACT
MSGRIEARLAERKIELPNAPAPVANYVPAVRSGNLLFVSGQGPWFNGELRYIGKVGRDLTVAVAQQSARLCALNVLAQARAALGDLDRVVRVVQVQGFVDGIPEFAEHPQVINGASDLFVEVFGEAGRHSRFAVGSGSLPGNISVEVAAIFEVE